MYAKIKAFNHQVYLCTYSVLHTGMCKMYVYNSGQQWHHVILYIKSFICTSVMHSFGVQQLTIFMPPDTCIKAVFARNIALIIQDYQLKLPTAVVHHLQCFECSGVDHR